MLNKKLSFYIWLGLGSIGGLAVSIGLIFFVVMGLIKASKPFKMAIADLESSEKVDEVLGSDWNQGLLVFGEISINGDQGFACLTIPVSGSSSKGKAYVDANKLNGNWIMNELTLELPNAVEGNFITVVEATPDHPKVCGIQAVVESEAAVQ